jgi:hypothetical protein
MPPSSKLTNVKGRSLNGRKMDLTLCACLEKKIFFCVEKQLDNLKRQVLGMKLFRAVIG